MTVPAGQGVESIAPPAHLIPPEFMVPKYPPGAPPQGALVQ
jgi:hypothetical protein